MSQQRFNLARRSKLALGFRVTAVGQVTVDVRWAGAVELSGFLFGPGQRTPYAQGSGSASFTLSKEVIEPMLSNNCAWVIQLSNPTTSPVQGTLSISSPSAVELRSLAPYDQDARKPAGVALFAHLLERYVHDAPNKTEADRAIMAALDKIPQAKAALLAAVNHWKSIPPARRQAIFGAEFATLPLDAAIPPDRLTADLRRDLDGPLPTIVTGLQGITLVEALAVTTLKAPTPVRALSEEDMPEMYVRSDDLGPTYRIDYAGLYCQQETEWDQSSNSDEPYVIFTVTDGWRTWSKRSDVYSDVDRGESRAPSPAPLSLFGETGPEPAKDMSIITTVMEHDFGDPDHYKWLIQGLVEAARAYAAAHGIPVPQFVANLVVEGINWLLDTGDDKIGVAAVILERDTFPGWAFAAPVSFKGLAYNLLSPVHYGGEWWNGAKYYVMYNVRHDLPYVPTQRWSDWEFLGGVIASAPAAASWASDRLDVFVRGTNNHMMHKWWNGIEWSGWEDLEGALTDAPASVSWGPNRIDCFIRGHDSQLWHKCWNGQTWIPWGTGNYGWVLIGGVIASAPAVASWAPNRLDVFARGTNNHLMHRWTWNGGQNWSGWEDLGGELTDAPAAVSWGPDRIDCFVRGHDSQLWHKWWDGSKWSGWELLGGVIASAPTVASWAPNRLDVFARGTNNHLMHKWWNGVGWSGWEDLGGELTDAPGAVSWGPNRIDCFVRGHDSQLWHKWTWLG